MSSIRFGSALTELGGNFTYSNSLSSDGGVSFFSQTDHRIFIPAGSSIIAGHINTNNSTPQIIFGFDGTNIGQLDIQSIGSTFAGLQYLILSHMVD